MSRFLNRTTQVIIDLALLAIAYGLAILVRFEGTFPGWMVGRLFVTWPYLVGFQYFLLVMFGVHRVSWRYFGMPDLARVVRAMLFAAGLAFGIRAGVGALAGPHSELGRVLIPYSVVSLDAIFAFLAITGARVGRRILAERTEIGRRRRTEKRARVPTLLIGAGRAGVLVAKEISGRPDLGIQPIGFLDDDPVKIGTVVHGVPVLGRIDQIATVAAKYHAKQTLVTIADASGKALRQIVELCDQGGLPVKVVPGLFEFIGDKVNLSIIRNVAIDDLLRREPVVLDADSKDNVLRDRVVLVTGAGGSIGSELCRQACRLAPKSLVLVEKAENSLFHIERELRDSFPHVPVVACIADICDEARIERVFKAHKPGIVFHAAAHKHVPMMEANPGEAVKNNTFGTKTLADTADRHGVGQFVMISTDKAVNPSSVMGATKRAAEVYIQALSQRSATRFVAVRFGNVLGSAGSVVPIFQEQIARGGPIKVTHPDMKRYFMTIPEATQLVIQAASIGRGGEIFILDMGEPIRIVDLARDLITLSGLRPGEDIDIVFTGPRPGEKLFEQLSTAEEKAERTRHPKIFIGKIAPQPLKQVEDGLRQLRGVTASDDAEEIRLALRALVREYAWEGMDPASSSPKPAPVSAPVVLKEARPG
jgi:FlaA1/EpsC-like NDP-sugar epimerase